MRLACEAQEVWFGYKPPAWTLKGISLQVPEGEFLSVLGPSGAGKTTLLKILAGLLRPQAGKVTVLEEPAANGAGSHTTQRPRVGYIPQQLGLVRGSTALENVLLGALGRLSGPLPYLGLFPRDEVERAREYLDLMGIVHKAHEKVQRLSGGERQRVAIARTLLQQPQVILADEFVSDLDLPRAAQILCTMRELALQEGIAFVVNLHDIPLVRQIGDRVIVLKEGCLVHRGRASELTPAFVREVMG